MEDPYLLDQNSLECKLDSLLQQLTRWRQLRDSDCDRDDEEELAWLTNELTQGCKSTSWDLDDLEETLRLMSESKQNQLTPVAMETRLAFISRCRQRLQEVSAEVSTKVSAEVSTEVSALRLATAADEDPDDHLVDSQATVALLADARDGRRQLARWKAADSPTFPSIELTALKDFARDGLGGGRRRLLKSRRARALATALLATAGIAIVVFVVVVVVRTAGSSRDTTSTTEETPAVTMATGTTTTGRSWWPHWSR